MTRTVFSLFWLNACLLAFAAPVLAQGWDEPSSKSSRTTGGSATPYTGLVVPADDSDPTEDEDAPKKKKKPEPAKKKKPAAANREEEEEAPEDPLPAAGSGIRLSDDPGPRRRNDTQTWEEDVAKPKGPAVIEINTAGPSVITNEDLKRDRQGISLGSGESKRGGLGLSAQGGDDFYGTFKANEDAPARLDDRELRDLERRQKDRGTPTSRAPAAPSGLLVMPDTDEEEEEPPEPPAPRVRQPAEVELRITGEGADRFRDSTPLVPGARGDGKSIKVEEYDSRSGIDTEIVAPSSKSKTKERVTQAPVIEVVVPRGDAPSLDDTTIQAPPIEPKKAPVAKPKPVEKPVEKPAVVVTPTEKPATESGDAPPMDPFEKLEREKAALEGRDYDAEQAAKKAAQAKSRDEALRELSAKGNPSASLRPEPSGPTGGAGLSIGLGAGALVLRDGSGGYVPLLAYGANVTWVPPFASFLGVDAGFWRAGRSSGSDAAFVDSSWNHAAFRLFLVQSLPGGVRAGVGPGLLVTINAANYAARINGGVEQAATYTRLGGDFTSFVGGRFGIIDVRLDLRVLLRGGLRLDFLPTLQVGVGF